jgi:hypothetical protein
VIKMLSQMHMIRLSILNNGFKIALTSILNSSFITFSFLITFNMLIFALFNLSLLIYTLQVIKVFQILEVAKKMTSHYCHAFGLTLQHLHFGHQLFTKTYKWCRVK